MKPNIPEDPASVVRSQLTVWMAELEVLSRELSKLAQGRFPEWSNERRRLMVQYLIDNGVAEVARKTPSGTPTWYRFVSLGDRRVGGKRKRLGIPDNELSMLHPGGQRPVRGVDPRPFASLGSVDSERRRLPCVLMEGHPSC